jgi:hypothetical protein
MAGLCLPAVMFAMVAISLLGQGEMDFQWNLAMNFHAVVGRDELRVPVLQHAWHKVTGNLPLW